MDCRDHGQKVVGFFLAFPNPKSDVLQNSCRPTFSRTITPSHLLIIRQRPIWNSRLCLSFSVSAGGEVELRLIGAGGDYGVVVSVDDHSMRVVSADGHNVLPVEVEKLILMPGERYDVRVRGNQAPDSYWIRARVLSKDGEEDKIDGT